MRIVLIISILLGVAFVHGQDCNLQISSEEATIIIPVASAPKINGSDLPIGSLIQAYILLADTIQCVGSTIWDGENTSLTVYGKDSSTPGYEDGEAYKFRIILPSGCIVIDVEITFLHDGIFNNEGAYLEDGISGLEELQGFSDFELEVVSLVLDTCAQGTGVIEIQAISQSLPINYEWSNGESEQMISGLHEGDSLSVIVHDNSGCPAGLDIVVKGKEILPEVDLDDTYDYCQGDSLLIATNSGDLSYDWLHDGILLEGAESASLKVGAPGVFAVNVRNIYGCIASDTTVVSEQIAPDLSLGNDTIICVENTVLLDMSCVGCSYNWSSGSSNNQIAAIPGNHQVTVTSSFGCELMDEMTITTFEVPNGISIENDTICPGNQATILIENSLNVSYLWSTGETGNQIIASLAGSYFVSITDTNECVLKDTIDVFYETFIDAQLTPVNMELCIGDTLDLLASGGSQYSWFENETQVIDGIGNLAVSPDSNSVYHVIIANTCFADTLFSNVEVLFPQGEAGQDTCSFIGSEVQLNASGGIDYFWYEDDFTFDDNAVANPIVILEDSTTLIVEIIDENGCLMIDSIHVAVLIDDPLVLIDKINFISPNGDGRNDILKFKNLKKFPNNKLTVFNRLGKVIFESKKYQNDWAGLYKGNEVPDGTYYYVLEVGNTILKSKLTIIRE